MKDCHIWNIYGPAEATIGSTYHVAQVPFEETSVPIGRPFPHCQCLILDEFLQPVMINQEGELFIGGAGVFAGYFDRNDLTEKSLLKKENQLFYRTGDLVRMKSNGLIYYVGRKDFQLKLRGQRVEPQEIEKCILNASPNISACVVIKTEDEHLVAYVESLDANENQVREYCLTRLPLFMVPSIFIALKQLPLNSNGKVDRTSLPSPTLSNFDAQMDTSHSQTRNEIEENVHDLWCKVLHRVGSQISNSTSFFSIGGHSLLLIELYYQYQILYGFDSRILSIAPFLRQTTIAEHAQLLDTINFDHISSEAWQPFYNNEGNYSVQ